MSQPTTNAVWTHLSDDLKRFIRSKVSDDHLADDLLQETFLRIHRNLERLQVTDRLAAWVYQIARNVISDHYRGSNSRPALIEEPEQLSEKPPGRHLVCAAKSLAWLPEFIQQLPEDYQQPLLLAEWEGLSQKEVADRLGLSLSAAKSRIQRGRVMLQEVLEQCCRFEFDRRGNLLDIDPRADRQVCRNCGPDCSSENG